VIFGFVVFDTVSVVVTTALLGLLYKPLRKNWDATTPQPAAAADTT
jgi:hypothetical protein